MRYSLPDFGRLLRDQWKFKSSNYKVRRYFFIFMNLNVSRHRKEARLPVAPTNPLKLTHAKIPEKHRLLEKVLLSSSARLSR